MLNKVKSRLLSGKKKLKFNPPSLLPSLSLRQTSRQMSTVIILVFLQVFGTSCVFADEFTKKLHKKYQVNDSTLLEIQNKFGNVHINSWDKNTVVIDVIITVKASDSEKADELLSYIDVSFSNEDNLIKAVTEIDEKFKSLKSKKFSIFYKSINSKNFSIDYNVSMPINLKLELYNKFGDIFIDELHGKTNIILKYGYLTANNLLFDSSKPLSKISLSYSKARIKKCNWLKLVSNYSKLYIQNSKALIVISKYSVINIEKSSSIISQAKYDAYEIGHTNNFVSTGRYTDYQIEQVNKKLDLDIKYGNCEIDFMPGNFKSIKLVSKYGNVEIGISSSASYKLNATMEYSNLEYLEKKVNLKKIRDAQKLTINGTIGNNQKTNSKVNILSKYGNVELTE